MKVDRRSHFSILKNHLGPVWNIRRVFREGDGFCIQEWQGESGSPTNEDAVASWLEILMRDSQMRDEAIILRVNNSEAECAGDDISYVLNLLQQQTNDSSFTPLAGVVFGFSMEDTYFFESHGRSDEVLVGWKYYLEQLPLLSAVEGSEAHLMLLGRKLKHKLEGRWGYLLQSGKMEGFHSAVSFRDGRED